MTYIAYNKEIVDENSISFKVADKAMFFDFAVYSSLKIIKGKMFFPEFHADRLLESAEILRLRHKFTKHDIIEMMGKVAESNSMEDAFLRLLLVGDPDANANAKLYIFPLAGVHYYPRSIYSKGAKAVTYSGERRFPTAKTKDLLLSFMAYREAEKAGAIDALLIDNDGNLREGTRSNLFAVKKGTIITPPAEKVLEGITKKIVLDLCKDRFRIAEEDIPLSKIRDYDEFFVTSTLFNVIPLNRIDNISLRQEFTCVKEIQRLFKEYYSETVFGKKGRK
ncbi:MAG: aminotransferase class IV [Candidatus Marsarchaeota archaeon]|nr:aminotransferase class IV [Candidatus Marsarchaeota archaeon]